jgi:23S rRNA G2445 N2-methylase RlmL
MPTQDQTGPVREFVGYFTKGLGDVVAGELREILRSPVDLVGEPGERFTVVTTSAEGGELVLAGARTVDDFRLLVAGPERVADEDGFRSLCTAAARRTEEFLAGDPGRADAPWSVTVSARNPPWSARAGRAGRASWSPGPAVAGILHGADVAGTARAPVDLRVQADGEIMHVAVNLAGAAAGRRAERLENRRGTLRPTVAAAMVRMALAAYGQAGHDVQGGSEVWPGAGASAGVRARTWAEVEAGAGVGMSGEVGAGGWVLYDPFAGSGTIVGEALRMGLGVFGSDVDPEAVRMTRERVSQLRVAGLRAAGLKGAGLKGAGLKGGGRSGGGRDDAVEAASVNHRIFVHDVRQGAERRVRANLVVGNMPWGKQIQIPRRQELFDGTAEVIRPVVTGGGGGGEGGVAVLLTTHEEQFTARLRRALPGTLITTRRIGLLGQTPAIVVVRPG